MIEDMSIFKVNGNIEFPKPNEKNFELSITIQQIHLLDEICKEYERLLEFHGRHPMQLSDNSINVLYEAVYNIKEKRHRLSELNTAIGMHGITETEIIKKAKELNIKTPKYLAKQIELPCKYNKVLNELNNQ